MLGLRLRPQPGVAIEAGTLIRIRVEGDAPADALATLVAEHLLRAPLQTRAFLTVECELDLPAHDLEHSYLRIHVDYDENGRVTVGDQVSFQVHHVAAAIEGEPLDVPLQLVAS